jgi:AAA ATPase containing von Willebrand factor type A (vWA) domain
MAGDNTDKKDDDQEVNFLNMSDEDIAKFDPSSMASASAADTTANDDFNVDEAANANKDDDAGEGEDGAAKNADATGENQEDKAGDGDDKGAGDGAAAEGTEGKAADEVTGAEGAKPGTKKDDQGKEVTDPPAKAADADKTAKADGTKDDTVADKAAVIDYEAAYKQLTAPFKANGRDIQVKSVEDAIALMQMGANYNKKMAGLKPSMQYLKMLESNGLLDTEKLSFLIDLSKKDPAAINKLVKDSGIDPLDLSADKAGEYRPGNHKVDERELELDAVLDGLEGSEHYNRTLEVVSTKWDEASKDVIVKKPEILTVINGHMASGIYDLIAAEIENERTFGRLKGLSDIDAYKHVGDAMNKEGKFDHLNVGSSRTQAKTAPAKVIVTPAPKVVDDAKLRDKKRAASSTKAAVPGATVPADFNPLGMSDEDFKKFKPI